MTKGTIKRGFFRVWLILLSLSLIIVPLWYFFSGMQTALLSGSCFELLEVSPPNVNELSAQEFLDSGVEGLSRIDPPETLCTNALTSEDSRLQALKRDWHLLTSLQVRFPDNVVRVVSTSSSKGVPALFTQSDVAFRRVVRSELLKESGMLEIAVIIAFFALWWIGRLTAALGLWVRRGFVERRN